MNTQTKQMATIVSLLSVTAFHFAQGASMARVGHKAPDFSCQAVCDGTQTSVSLADYAGKWKLIFFYPKDFTFICPTELHALQECLGQLDERNVAVLGVSTDDVQTHAKWLETPKSEGGVQGVCYPLLADPSTQMARDYGVYDENEQVALRAIFLVDPENVVQASMIYNCSVGRNMQELLRIIDAFQYVAEYGELCPVNWEQGGQTLQPNEESLHDYFASKK